MLPFVVGAVVGAVAVVTYNNSDKIRKTINMSAKKVKDAAEEGFEKTKEMAKDVKANVDEKVECLKSKEKEPDVEVKGE